MSGPAVAVAVPAFNEADGITGFLEEIDRALTPLVGSLRIVVVDDDSTDATRASLLASAPSLTGSLEVMTNQSNRGHGPSVMAAYRHALRSEPDFVLQVDGDGQFHGSDLRRVLILLMDDARAVCGVRRFRQDPWFRMRMTGVLRLYLSSAFSVRTRDANCPLRGYEASLLREVLAAVPDDCLIPNLYLTIVAARRGYPLLEVDVSHRVRRGGSIRGTMWGKGASPIPWRLLRFSAEALRESLRFRAELRRRGIDAPGLPQAAPEPDSDRPGDHRHPVSEVRRP